jgi:hypothetical protein
MPWKNGGGLTEEIATHPEGSTLETFGLEGQHRPGSRARRPVFPFPGDRSTITPDRGRRMRLLRQGITC